MDNQELLVLQALKTYERLKRKLDSALDMQKKMPTRASRTTAFAAFQGRINKLRELNTTSYARYLRRREKLNGK
jgi:hypothetical protein